MTDSATGVDGYGRSTIWTYRSTALYVPGGDEAEARRLILAEAYRAVPEEQATATILSIRVTPTGRFSALIKRERKS